MRSNNVLNPLAEPFISCLRCTQICICVNNFFFLVRALVVHKLRYMRLLIMIPGLKIYTNWYHIFHIDIDTFATCKWIFEIWISTGYLDLKNALKPVLGWYMIFGKTIYEGTRLVSQNGDVSPTTTLPNQQHSHKLHKKNKWDPFTPWHYFSWLHGNSIPIKLAATIFGLD